MKIRLALLEPDTVYAGKLVSALSFSYSDRLEVYSFTDPAAAERALSEMHINVFLANPEIMKKPSLLPNKCAFGFLVEESGIQKYEGRPAVCKYQKTELIFKQVLDLYAETASGVVSAASSSSGEKRFVGFASPGGSGASTAAAAYALRCVQEGWKTLYLNLEKYGSSEVFFTADGQFSLSDIIFSIKWKRSNLSIKLESCVRRSSQGVFFFAPTTVVLERMEMQAEEIKELLRSLREQCDYDRVIVDMDFDADAQALLIWDELDKIVWVSDGSAGAETKIARAVCGLQLLDKSGQHRVQEKLSLLYSKASAAPVNAALNVLGQLPTAGDATALEQAMRLLSCEAFAGL